MFTELSPRFGVVPALRDDAVSEASTSSMPGNRCISVGHKSEISGPILRALKATGVEYVSTRSIGVDHIDLKAGSSAPEARSASGPVIGSPETHGTGGS